MKTTYFWKAMHEPTEGAKYVSISRKTPDYVEFGSYPDLFPSWELIELARSNDYSTFEEYERRYLEHLEKLDANKVYEDLKDCTLVCFESSKDLACGKKFCHRRIVAKWLKAKLGIDVPEELRDKETDLDVDRFWFGDY